MNVFLSRCLNRPVIHISPFLDQPVIGFAKEIQGEELLVMNYVTGDMINVSDQGTSIFTKERYDALFLMDPNLLLSFIYNRSSESWFPQRLSWNLLSIASSLHRHKFFEAYDDYLNCRDEQPATEI